jgi:hypothetical protein
MRFVCHRLNGLLKLQNLPRELALTFRGIDEDVVIYSSKKESLRNIIILTEMVSFLDKYICRQRKDTFNALIK